MTKSVVNIVNKSKPKPINIALGTVDFQKTDQYDAQTIHLRTPCLLPELSLIDRIDLVDERYWGLSFVLSDATNTASLSRLRFVLVVQ